MTKLPSQPNRDWKNELSLLIFEMKFDILLPNIISKEEKVMNGPEIEMAMYERLEAFIAQALAEQRDGIVKIIQEKIRLLDTGISNDDLDKRCNPRCHDSGKEKMGEDIIASIKEPKP